MYELIKENMINLQYTRIKSDDQYDLYSERHEKLTFENYEKHLDEIELIEILLDEYISRSREFEPSMSPIQVIEFLLKENNLSKSQLSREINVSRQLVSDILSFRRDLSKAMIIKLSKRFKLNPSIFTREYKLKEAS